MTENRRIDKTILLTFYYTKEQLECDIDFGDDILASEVYSGVIALLKIFSIWHEGDSLEQVLKRIER